MFGPVVVKPLVHPVHRGLLNGNMRDYNPELWELPDVTKLNETKTFPYIDLQHLQLIWVLKTVH
jgi:hypothetical protein